MASFGFRKNELPRQFNGKLGFGGDPKEDFAGCTTKVREDTVASPPRRSISLKIPKVIKQKPIAKTVKKTVEKPANKTVVSKSNYNVSTSSVPSNAVITITMKNSLFKRVLGGGQ